MASSPPLTKKRRRPSGYRNRRVREASALPLGWRHLTAVDIERLISTIDAQTGAGAKLSALEACLLLWSSLVTGRDPAELLTMSIRMVLKGANLQGEDEGLISHGGQWAWWLSVGDPRQKRADGPMCPTSDFIFLPATSRVAGLVKRCVALRRTAAPTTFNISGAAQPLFSGGNSLLADLTTLLAARHEISPERARRATTTPETVARWLPRQLIGMAGGDPVAAGLISGDIEAPAVTPSYYGAVSHPAAVKQYRKAVESIDRVSRIDLPGQVASTYIGDRKTPTDKAVRGMIKKLASALDDSAFDVAEHHRAMTRYTVALLAFAFAHRGTIEMPSLQRVDPDAGFCWIVDKVLPAGRRVRRMVWVCACARQQLRLYEEHLDRVHANVSEAAASAIADLRVAAEEREELALFNLTDVGRVETVKIAQALGDAMGEFGLRSNAGRHWLRGQLLGICSTETLHAFYGHGLLDDGSWDASSALDPAAYRADLAVALDPVLENIGWTPSAGMRS